MKKVFRFLALWLCIALILPISVSTLGAVEPTGFERRYADKGFVYTLSDGEAKAVEYLGDDGESLVIPDTLGGYPLTVLDSRIFYKNDVIKNVTIPDSVKIIAKSAFEQCRNLEKVTLPASLCEMGENAFAECSSLSGIILPDTLTEIPQGAFSGCKKLKTVKFPAKVEKISNEAFFDCEALLEIELPETLTFVADSAFRNCALLEKITAQRGKKYYSYHNCLITLEAPVTLVRGCKNSIFPDDFSIKVIGNYAFSGCRDIGRIVLNYGVNTIGAMAFASCGSLGEIELPISVQTIEEYAFLDCKTLHSIRIPRETKTVKGFAFSGCRSLKNIKIEANLTEIAQGTFKDCTSLAEIEIPDSVKAIKEEAFSGCKSLENIHLPKSLKTVGSAAFYACTLLENVEMNDSLECIENRAFEKCAKLRKMRFPDSISEIAKDAFDSKRSKTFICKKGSVPYEYALDNGINIVICGGANIFRDIPEKSWYTEASLACYGMGIMNGVGENTFSPASHLTRAQVVQILYAVSKNDLHFPLDYNRNFVDVKRGAWYYDAVYFAYTTRISSGVSFDRFDPNGAVTREMLATMLFAFAKYKNFDIEPRASLSSYADSNKVARWAKEALEWATGSYIISGTSQTLLSPKSVTTRAQMAVMMNTLMKQDLLYGNGLVLDVTAYRTGKMISAGKYELWFDFDFYTLDGRSISGKDISVSATVDINYGSLYYEVPSEKIGDGKYRIKRDDIGVEANYWNTNDITLMVFLEIDGKKYNYRMIPEKKLYSE